MRQFVTFTIDASGKAEVIASPCDPPEAHKAAATRSKLNTYLAQTTLCKRVAKAKAEEFVPKVRPSRR